jgi:hypothetical protein
VRKAGTWTARIVSAHNNQPVALHRQSADERSKPWKRGRCEDARVRFEQAIPTLPTAAPNIPCAMKPKPNTKKIEDRAKPNRLPKIVAPLRLAMDKAARPVKL